ncbi:MAG: LIC10235 family protein [Spirochaetota bacterium]
MKSVKTTVKDFEKVLKKIGTKSLEACGTYIIGDFRLDVRKTKPLSGSERVSLLYKRRKEQGLCVVCGKKVTKKNPKNGQLYRLCETHRTKIDKSRKR